MPHVMRGVEDHRSRLPSGLGWKQILWDYCGNGNKCRRTPARVEKLHRIPAAI